MAKGLCYAGMFIAGVVLLFFLIDLIAASVGLEGVAPFRGASILMDIMFVACAAGLGYLSWSTLKEQV